MSVLFVGIDNGISGSVGIIKIKNGERKYSFFKIPTTTHQDYTKRKKNINRISVLELDEKIRKWCVDVSTDNMYVAIERPMVNPGRFMATTSAMRAMEATLIVIERFGCSYQWIDSKEWQKVFLPNDGKADLKRISMDIGVRMFPHCMNRITKHKDADGLLIAEYLRRLYHEKEKE